MSESPRLTVQQLDGCIGAAGADSRDCGSRMLQLLPEGRRRYEGEATYASKSKSPAGCGACFRVDTEIPGLCCLFRLDQQLAFDPYLTCTPSFLLSQTARRDQFDSGSGLTTNRANQTTPRDSNFAFDVSCSPQPAARYRPLPPLDDLASRVSPSVSSKPLAGSRRSVKDRRPQPLWR